MPRGCAWHFVGRYRIDPDVPGGHQAQDEYVSTDRKGMLYVRVVDEEDDWHPFTMQELVGFYEDRKAAELWDTLVGLPGWEALVRMIEFRMKAVA